MKTVILLCCLTVTALAVNEKQLQLEDIERENLANERKLKQEKQSASISSLPQKIVSTQLEYGFKPIKSFQKYVQPQQQVQIPQQIQYTYPQYTTQLAYTQFPQYQYQQYENVPYIADNQLVQNPQPEQYYGQQFVYLQPFASPSSNIQMVVDPKGNVKYYMYVPTQYFSSVKNDDDPIKNIQVKTAHVNSNHVGPHLFTREPDYQQFSRIQSQYITQPQLPPQPVTQQTQNIQPTQAPPTQSQSVQSPQQPLINTQYVQQSKPQSLLDSYVPSILQLQYYKQQQEARANGIRESPKTVVPRTTLTRQTLHIPNANIEPTYSFPLPSPYRTHTFKN